jgi:hypothetical protein
VGEQRQRAVAGPAGRPVGTATSVILTTPPDLFASSIDSTLTGTFRGRQAEGRPSGTRAAAAAGGWRAAALKRCPSRRYGAVARGEVAGPRGSTARRGTRWSALDDAPTDYSELFGLTVGTLHPMAYADVPELAALIEYVRGREDLRSRVYMLSATGNTEIEDRVLALGIADLPLSLLYRARATGAATDDELLLLYLQRERAWLLDPLPVEYVIPLALTALDLDAPLIIDDSIRIEPLDTATQAARASSELLALSTVPDPVRRHRPP